MTKPDADRVLIIRSLAMHLSRLFPRAETLVFDPLPQGHSAEVGVGLGDRLVASVTVTGDSYWLVRTFAPGLPGRWRVSTIELARPDSLDLVIGLIGDTLREEQSRCRLRKP